MSSQSVVAAESLLLAARSLSSEGLRGLISGLMDSAKLNRDERVELLGGLLVSEAVRPYWESGLDAEGAHRALRNADPELADAVEAVSPMLLGRVEAHNDAQLAIVELERLLRH